MKRIFLLLLNLVLVLNICSMDVPQQEKPSKSLIFAIADGDAPAVAWHLKNRPIKINALSPLDETLLSLAIRNDRRQIVGMLLEAGANPNIRIAGGRTALYEAILKNNYVIADMLIDAKADINAQDDFKQTPLMAAAMMGSELLVEKLIKLGAHIRDKNVDGHDAIDFARANCNEPIANILVAAKLAENPTRGFGIPEIKSKKNVAKNAKGKKPAAKEQKKKMASVWQAIPNGDLELFKWHLGHGLSGNEKNNNGESLLIVAAKAGNYDMVQLLLQRKILLDATNGQGNTALMEALAGGHTEVAELLLKAGANPRIKNNHDESAFLIAIIKGNEKIIEPLLKAGVDLNERVLDNKTPLMIAASHNNQNIIKILLARGAIIGAKDDSGHTAFDYACTTHAQNAELLLRDAAKNLAQKSSPDRIFELVRTNDLQNLQELLMQKVEINIQNAKGTTPLALAIQLQHTPMVKALLASGARVDIPNEAGLMALHIAVMTGQTKIAKLLLDAGANVNVRDTYRGRTPLQWVVRMAEGSVQKILPLIPMDKSVAMMKLLLAHGADRTLVDFGGKAPLDWAKINGMKPLVELLVEPTPKLKQKKLDRDGKENNGKVVRNEGRYFAEFASIV